MKLGKVLRKTLKILLITLASLVLLIVILLTVAKLSENQISRIVLNKVSEMIEAPVKVDSVSLLLLRRFPYATVEFHGFKMGVNKNEAINSPNIAENDTLISIRKLYVSIKSKPLLKNKIEIENIEIEGFAFNYNVDSTGVSNIDFLLETDSTQIDEEPSASVLDVLLSNLTVRDVTITYNDEQLKARAKLHFPEMDLAARVLNEFYAGSIKGKVLATNMGFDGTNIHLMEQMSADFSLAYEDGKVDIESMQVQTDGATLSAKGEATLADSMFVNLAFSLSDADIKKLSKYAPTEMLSEYGLIDMKGKLDLNANVIGYVYDTLLLPSVDATMSLKNGSITTKDYPNIRHISFSGSILAADPNNMQTVSANFKNVSISTASSSVNFDAKVANIDKPIYNIKARGQVNLNEFAAFIPDSTVEYLTGSMCFNMTTKGQLPDDIGLHNADYFLDRTSLDLVLKNICTALDSVTEVKNLSAKLTYKPTRQIVLEYLSLDAPSYNVKIDSASANAKLLGMVKDMDNMGVEVESFYFGMGANSAAGSFSLDGLTNPSFKINAALNLDFEELRPFMPDSLVTFISGTTTLNIKSYGTVNLDSIEQSAMPIAFEQSIINGSLRDFNVTLPDDTLIRVDKLSMDFSMANDTIRIKNLFTNVHGIDLWSDSTEIWNVYKAFLLEQKDMKIIVNTHMRASDIDYDKFAPLLETDSTEVIVPDEDPMYIPQYIVRGTLKANSVKYGNMVLRDATTKFRVDDSLYVADDLRFNAFGGSMVTSVLYDMRYADQEKVEFKNTIKGMDIRQLLIDANDFDQTYFTHKNIEGILTSSINGRILVTGDSIHYDKIAVLGNFKLENGGIYDFEPAMELSKFTNLRELDRIVFRTMVSSVFIYNNKIFFPQTDIVSSALDMAVYGMESFGDDYEYHLNVHLGDVLLGKSQKLLKRQGMESDVFEGEDKSNRTGLFLVSYKKGKETKNGFDTKQLQKMMKTTIRVHERGLNLIFNPLLQNFSTDIDRKERKRN
ncbi:MAG: AsmA-like C-terminal region-containing protein [Bacteroidales bacterium]|jgi:hypothetical protein|nr:AsmA-like C-terminal region-containing protein [Bacteroidales bacterium]MDD4384291.1 AsmA-like C-terminal region-containing protein [Bacteroidales bacterium]MDY0196738.1 AsmA-like C-terminal region-containing protein [Tenuifilaceae bacterium]